MSAPNANTTVASNKPAGPEPNKTTGQYHSVKGTLVQSIGDVTGLKSWQNSGREEHAAGEAEVHAAEAKAFVEGAAQRVAGKKDSIMGAITGNKEQQMRGNLQQEKGATKQNANRW